MNKQLNLFESEAFVGSQETSFESPQQEVEIRFHVKRIIEALLFASSEPLSFTKIREIADSYYQLKPKMLLQLIEELKYDYLTQRRAFCLEETTQGFILKSHKEYGCYIEQLNRNKRTEKLSHASTEVLAIIAYRQPISKPQIEAIRGVDSTGIIQTLVEKQLIEAVGKLESSGRPTLYGITKAFLAYFGLKDLNDLPKFDKNKHENTTL